MYDNLHRLMSCAIFFILFSLKKNFPSKQNYFIKFNYFTKIEN